MLPSRQVLRQGRKSNRESTLFSELALESWMRRYCGKASNRISGSTSFAIRNNSALGRHHPTKVPVACLNAPTSLLQVSVSRTGIPFTSGRTPNRPAVCLSCLRSQSRCFACASALFRKTLESRGSSWATIQNTLRELAFANSTAWLIWA